MNGWDLPRSVQVDGRDWAVNADFRDVLDVIGNEALLGKPVHSDEKNEKTTWVTVYGLEQAKKEIIRI